MRRKHWVITMQRLHHIIVPLPAIRVMVKLIIRSLILRFIQFTDDEVSSMQQQVSHPRLAHNDRVYINFALGKAFEDRNSFAESFTITLRAMRSKRHRAAIVPVR